VCTIDTLDGQDWKPLTAEDDFYWDPHTRRTTCCSCSSIRRRRRRPQKGDYYTRRGRDELEDTFTVSASSGSNPRTARQARSASSKPFIVLGDEVVRKKE
jgi:hypothetical protein